MLIFGCNNIDLITAHQFCIERNNFSVHLRSDTVISYVTVNFKSEINRSRINWQPSEITGRSKYVNFILIKLEFKARQNFFGGFIFGRTGKYIPDPVVTVSTQQLNGNKVYVIGKVTRPGEIVANRYMDVLQALSVAGGMTPYASANKIKVLRRENGELTAIPFRYGDIEKGEDLEQNIILQSGDVIMVP